MDSSDKYSDITENPKKAVVITDKIILVLLPLAIGIFLAFLSLSILALFQMHSLLKDMIELLVLIIGIPFIYKFELIHFSRQAIWFSITFYIVLGIALAICC